MTDPTDEEPFYLRDEVAIWIRIKIGFFLIGAAVPFVWMAGHFLGITLVDFDQLYYLLYRNDGERRNSRYGLEMMRSFHAAYFDERGGIPADCYGCDFSKDASEGRKKVHCAHPDAPAEQKSAVLNGKSEPPADCPIRLRKKLQEETDGN